MSEDALWQVLWVLPSLIPLATIGMGTLMATLLYAVGRPGAGWVALAGLLALLIDVVTTCGWLLLSNVGHWDWDGWPFFVFRVTSLSAGALAFAAVCVSAGLGRTND